MAIEYKLSYTADDINNKLGKIEQLSQDVANLKTNADANTVISNHNMSSTAHEDIRELIDNIIVPTKVSELTNDSGYLISIPSEYITETELNNKGYLTEHQSLDGYAKTADIPTKVSELTNDSGYLTSYIETDPTVPAWAKASTKPTYTASEVGADVSGAAASALTDAKSYTDTKIANLINGAPTTLDTLGEIATAMQNNEDVVEALDNAIGTKANLSDLTSHTGNKSNPHGVTAAQVGADPSGSASAVQSNLNTHTNNKSNPHDVTASQIGALPVTGGTISGGLIVSNKLTQGSPSEDSTITSMNRFQSDLFIQGDGSAPNNPQVAGFYLGKSETDENRHLDIVSGADYSYIDFNKASSGNDFTARILVNVTDGNTIFNWGDNATNKTFNVLGALLQQGVPVALQSDIPSKTETWTFTLEDGSTVTKAVYVG